MSITAMNPVTRSAALEDMAGKELDILVVGGGITGAGIVMDAISRGLRVGIVEAQDWASGSSSRSSKLAHGGLRYLQQLDFKLVTEALHERELLLTSLAPHLVKPISFLYPLHKRVIERPYVTAGIGLYDVLARIGGTSKEAAMPFHKHYTREGVRKIFPDFRADAMVGAVKYWDGRVDDARLTLNIVRTAVEYGALAANRARVADFIEENGTVVGAEVVDLENGSVHSVRAKKVVAAAGVWTEATQDMAEADGGLKVLASKGIHIVVPKERIRGESGLILQTETSVLFVIPWERYWVIGTTDTPYHQDLVHPVASAADIDYVIEHANVVLETPLTRDDVIGTWAGLRPLLQPGTKDGGQSSKVSREHTVSEAKPGLITIAGGKLTTYRVMAKDAIDVALGAEAKNRPSETHRTPLLGADGYHALQGQVSTFGAKHGWDEARVQHLLDRYGSEIVAIEAMVAERPDLANELAGAPAYLRAEIAFGCVKEGALHLEDLLVNRTRLTYEVADSGEGAAQEVTDLAAELLGWDEDRKASEMKAYADRCAAERYAAEQPDDKTAAEARGDAGQIVGVPIESEPPAGDDIAIKG